MIHCTLTIPAWVSLAGDSKHSVRLLSVSKVLKFIRKKAGFDGSGSCCITAWMLAFKKIGLRVAEGRKHVLFALIKGKEQTKTSFKEFTVFFYASFSEKVFNVAGPIPHFHWISLKGMDMGIFAAGLVKYILLPFIVQTFGRRTFKWIT